MFAECILIAHTKTQADNQMLQIKKRKNLSSLNEVQQSQQFRNSLQFNEKYVDNELLPQSRKNNENLKKVVSSKDIQIVLVSPQKAALQTCLDLFGDKEGIQIYVQPLLHPRINSAPFIPKNNQQILQKFKKEPYTNKITQNKTWFLNYGSQDTHTATSESPQDHCLDMIRQIGDFQLQSMFAQRNNKFRKQLFDYITKSKKTIALITHPLMCQSLTATGWHEDGTPINSSKFDFGQIRREHIWIEGVIAEAEEKHTPLCGG